MPVTHSPWLLQLTSQFRTRLMYSCIQCFSLSLSLLQYTMATSVSSLRGWTDRKPSFIRKESFLRLFVRACVTTSRACVTTSRACVTTSRACVTTSRACVTTSRACVTPSRGFVTTSRACVTTSRACVTTSRACVTPSRGFVTTSRACVITYHVRTEQHHVRTWQHLERAGQHHVRDNITCVDCLILGRCTTEGEHRQSAVGIYYVYNILLTILVDQCWTLVWLNFVRHIICICNSTRCRVFLLNLIYKINECGVCLKLQV